MKRNFSAIDNNIYNYNKKKRNENKSLCIENTNDNLDNFFGRSFVQRQNVKKKNSHVTLLQKRVERKGEIERTTPERKRFNEEKYLKIIKDLEKEIKKLKEEDNDKNYNKNNYLPNKKANNIFLNNKYDNIYGNNYDYNIFEKKDYDINDYENYDNNSFLNHNEFINYEELKKENFLLKKVISEQKEKINELEQLLISNDLYNFKQKEEKYLQKIYELESYNKQLNSLISYTINSNQKELKTNENEKEKTQKKNLKSFSQSEFYIKNLKKNNRIKTNKSLENLINEKEMLIKNANYNENDPIIIHLNNKIDKYKKYM